MYIKSHNLPHDLLMARARMKVMDQQKMKSDTSNGNGHITQALLENALSRSRQPLTYDYLSRGPFKGNYVYNQGITTKVASQNLVDKYLSFDRSRYNDLAKKIDAMESKSKSLTTDDSIKLKDYKQQRESVIRKAIDNLIG
ncbi:hypothetical protein SL040_004632 [Aeromonas salmonicida]|nr:hypothetical protein [Aeromonas salmonicida]ELY2004323.1 hypothetical protein [Aeromonas salmonicida]